MLSPREQASFTADLRVLLATPLVLFLALSYVAFVLLAWLTPKTVLDDWSQARELTDWVASIVPQVDVITRIGGPAAQVNRFVFSVIWICAPLYGAVLAVFGYRRIRAHGCKFGTYGHVFATFAGGALFLLLFLLFPWSATGRAAAMFRGDVARSLWTPVWAFAPSLIVTGLVLVVACIVIGRLDVEDKTASRPPRWDS